MRIGTLLLFGMLMQPALQANSSPWGVQSVQQTNIPSLNLALLSPEGYIYFAEAGQAASISKETAAGDLVFTVQIAGVFDPNAILLGPDDNLYVTGFAIPGVFVTTPGAYEATGTGRFPPFLCGLSSVDGHILFCTFVDTRFPGGFAVDSMGNTYTAGIGGCFGSNGACVEKFNATGGIVYGVTLTDYIAAVAPDAGGNLFVMSGGSLLKMDPTGRMLGSVTDTANSFGWLSLDPSGNPQVIMTGVDNGTAIRVRRYSADLSSVLFDVGFNNIVPYSMLIDSTGSTLVLGATDLASVPQVHPTAACAAQSSPETYGSLPTNFHTVMVRLDPTGQLLQSTYVPALPVGYFYGTVQSDGATLLFVDFYAGTVAVATLGPAPEIQLGCIANAASLRIGALSPEEIISLTGSNIGPSEPVSGQPGADGRFPFELGGFQVTFDGVAAPLLYVSNTQINAVSPVALTAASTHVCVVLTLAVTTNCIDVPVVAADPGIFMNGTHAAALNQDGTINSETNPATLGSIVSIFATGLGTITPAPPDGSLVGFPLPAQTLQVQALAGFVNEQLNMTLFTPLPVYYAGPAPYEVEGLTQINTEAVGGACVAASSDTFTAMTAICPPIWVTSGQ